MKMMKQLSIFGLILVILIISSYAIARYYKAVKFPEPAFQNESEQNLILPEKKVIELKEVITRTDISLTETLNQMGLAVKQVKSNKEEVEINENIYLIWEKKSGVIEVPTFDRNPRDLAEVKEALCKAVESVGVELLRTEKIESDEKIEESVYFGFILDDLEVLTHQYVLTKIKPRARLAFIIDDLGYPWSEFERMMTIPRPMTFAVLPHLPRSVEQAKRVLKEGYDLILHLPMEARSSLNPGKGAIYTGMTEEEIVKTLASNLASLPEGIIGVNNHMGSKATEDIKVMKVVLTYLKEHGLFFIDSSTTPNSVATAVARQIGEDYGVNYIFIDNVDKQEAIEQQILKAGKIALRRGKVIAIGHVRKYTARAILSMIDDLEEMGIQIIYVKDILERFE